MESGPSSPKNPGPNDQGPQPRVEQRRARAKPLRSQRNPIHKPEANCLWSNPGTTRPGRDRMAVVASKRIYWIRRLQPQSVAGTASSRALIQFHIPGAGGSTHKKRAEPKPCPFQIQTVETVMNFSHLFYHLNLRPNLTVLAGAFPSVPRIFMKLEEVTLRLGLPKCGVFVALNISARNSVDSHSVTLN